VSGSDDKTIKVWDLGAPRALKSLLLGQNCRLLASLAGNLELLSEKINAHSRGINSVAFSPDGTKIVSACNGGTIKVWDLGAPQAQNRPSMAKTDACWLVWQARWGC
jgi:WD40 repeat protein